jgi:hypothetical protein
LVPDQAGGGKSEADFVLIALLREIARNRTRDVAVRLAIYLSLEVLKTFLGWLSRIWKQAFLD